MKMSILGIRNEIHLLGMEYDVNHDAHAKIVGMATQAEASLLAWEKKYPSDTMLARHVYLLEHLYASIQASDGQTKAIATAQWLFVRYPKSWYAKNLKMTLARDQAAQKAMAAAPSSLPDHASTSQTAASGPSANVPPVNSVAPISSAAPVSPATAGTGTAPSAPAQPPAAPAAPPTGGTSSSSGQPAGHGTQ